MKVLIIGSYGFLTEHLIAGFHRKKWDVFLLSGKRRTAKRKNLPPHILFPFEEDSADIRYVMQGSRPDYVIFTGVWDETYDWERENSVGAYSSALSNALNWAGEYQVKRFCYLSCMDAKHPDNVRARQARLGEQICRAYADGSMQITVLRTACVYGAPVCPEDRMDPLSEQIFRKRTGRSFSVPDTDVCPVHIYDLSDAACQIGEDAGQTRDFDCFELCGKETLSGTAFREFLDTKVSGEASAETACLRLTDTEISDDRRLEEAFGFCPSVGLQSGLGFSARFIEKNFKKIEKYYAERNAGEESFGQRVRALLKAPAHIVENVLLFLLVTALQTALRNVFPVLEQTDFLLFYIVIIAVHHSVGGSILAAVLASAGSLWLAVQDGGNINGVLTGPEFIVKVLFYFILAICISYSILRKRILIDEKTEQLENLQEEYEKIVEINNTNVEIKNEFESRLINYDDSIGKLQKIISELDSLEVYEIASQAVRVVSSVMNVEAVSLYYAGKEGKYHFIDATTSKNAGKQRTFVLSEYQEMQENLMNKEIYVNREVGSELPRMAAPIFRGDKLIFIIMLWNMNFDDLNVYKKNRLLILVRIISFSLEKSYRYEMMAHYQNYYAETSIMRPQAFESRVIRAMEGKLPEELRDVLIRIDTAGKELRQVDEELDAQVRTTDRLGVLKEEDSYVYLLAHATLDKAQFIIQKLMRNGYTSKVVMLDEIKCE